MAIAVATPPIFPTPTVPPIAVATASKGVINPLAFPSPLLPVLIVFNIVSEKICFK